MAFQSFFHLLVCLSILTGANCTPAGYKCGCAPPSPPPCAPMLPVTIDRCGPSPCPLPPINAPPVQGPLVTKPPVVLPAVAPPPKTIANTCHCIKTVVKPQIVQQLITVPTIQRYIQTTATPVIENIHYQGIPVNCPPYAPEPAAPCAVPAPPPVAPPCLPPVPALPPCMALPKPAAPVLHPSLLALLLAAKAAAPPPAPACLPAPPPCLPAPPPCLPPAPALPPCMPCLPPPALSVSLPPSLLTLLSKLLS